MLLINNPVQAAARTAWGEARGEGPRGLQAVLNVIGNRAQTPGWWGHGIADVCQKPAQFSCWNSADPNRAKLLAVSETNDPQFRQAVTLAGCLVADHLPDLTNGADHYFDRRGPVPYWAKGKVPCAIIGNHAFYRRGLRGDAT
ncbi:MAG: cell wall hydrolase [Acetobacter orientalis]|uniref:cell wall hydrolase n=1 Tax=Acetobacter orientalis TaxID=146474 RepID=UPI0039E954D8